MDVRVSGSWTVTVRLHGVECPLTPRALRETATRYTSRLVLDTDVRVEVRGTASQSVVYGEVFPAVGQDSINVRLVRDGLAKWASAYAAGRTDLGDAQTNARDAQRGLWGAPDGANVALPPSVADESRRQEKNRLVVQTVSASPTPAPSASQAPVLPESSTSDTAPTSLPPAAKPTNRAALLLIGGVATFVGTLLALLGYGAAQGLAFSAKRLVTQVLLAGIAGGLGAMVFAFPISAFSETPAGNPFMGLLCAGVGPFLAITLLRFGVPPLLASSRLRGTPVDPRRAEPGFVKIQGVARTVNREIACSEIGNIQGLYVREITARYTSETIDGKRLPSPRWITLRDTTIAVDFEIFSSAGDGTGSALVLADQDEETPPALVRARWLAYHVARFYNEVPTDAWFATAYEGDTRSEVFFVPSRATLTVWGMLYPPPPGERAPEGTFPVPRIAPDSETGTLLICDGPEARAYSGRGGGSFLLGALLIMLGLLAGAAAIYGIVAVGDLARQTVLASLGVGLILILFLAIRRGAILAKAVAAEVSLGEDDPARRSASIAWDAYKNRFPGAVIAPAVND